MTGRTEDLRQNSTMETLRDLSSALWSIRTHQEAARVLRTTNSLLRCFLFFDVCYLISGVALITLALTSQVDTGRDTMIMYGGIFGVFASVSALCNSLANHGLRTWKRLFLLPWLIFFLLVLAILVVHLAHNVYFHRAQWRHLFLFLANIAVFTCWRQMHRQFLLMKQPRPQAGVVDVEAMMREYLRPIPSRNSSILLKDPPPKYEELGQQECPPPEYQEHSQELQPQLEEGPPPEYQECLQDENPPETQK